MVANAFCKQCGSELPQGQVFCTSCGAKGGEVESAKGKSMWLLWAWAAVIGVPIPLFLLGFGICPMECPEGNVAVTYTLWKIGWLLWVGGIPTMIIVSIISGIRRSCRR